MLTSQRAPYLRLCAPPTGGRYHDSSRRFPRWLVTLSPTPFDVLSGVQRADRRIWDDRADHAGHDPAPVAGSPWIWLHGNRGTLQRPSEPTSRVPRPPFDPNQWSPLQWQVLWMLTSPT